MFSRVLKIVVILLKIQFLMIQQLIGKVRKMNNDDNE